MPRQLIYTSVPRGLTPGQSGYCTVARSRDLRDALIPRLEKLSYYTPEPNHKPIICAHRILDIRGAKFHVLTRIVDAGHDFTKRRSFLAHHLVFEPSEVSSIASPAELFVIWKGWLDQWHGDPQWLEDNRPIPSRTHSAGVFPKTDVWITAGDPERGNFLRALADRGVDWDVTFTNCFQPGDHADDFDIKAAWPNTPGFEAAKRLDAQFIRLDELPKPKLHIGAAHAAPERIASQEPAAHALPSNQRRSSSVNPIFPFAAVAVTIIAFMATLYHRKRIPDSPIASPAPAVVAKAPEAPPLLDLLLPKRPTWLGLMDRPSTIGPVEALMHELNANEVFTKNLAASMQLDLLKPGIPVTVLAYPEENLIRFTATNVPAIDLVSAAAFKTVLTNSFAVEIAGRFRIVAIKTPVELPRDFVTVSPNIELRDDLAERVHRLEIPSGAQFALRPLVRSKERWIDPLADMERDFALIPSTILDLRAVDAHAQQLIADKAAKLRAYEDEATALAGVQKNLLTDAQTAEQLKGKDRLATLQLAIPKAREELESLRAKAADIPRDANHIDRFALFLCLSNVNTEIFRFADKP